MWQKKIKEQVNDADFIFITHSHYDHFSIEDIKKVKRDNTKFVAPFDLKEKIIDIIIRFYSKIMKHL